MELISIFTSAILLLLGQNGVLPESKPTSPLSFWAAQTVYILTSTVLMSHSLRKIDEALAKAQREQQQPRVEIGMREENSESIFFVKDNGLGSLRSSIIGYLACLTN